MYDYLSNVTPTQLVDKTSGNVLTDFSKVDGNTALKPGDFRLNSYEWGVTYTGMLEAGKATGDKKYTDYTIQRVNFLGDVYGHFKNYVAKNPGTVTAVRSLLDPACLRRCRCHGRFYDKRNKQRGKRGHPKAVSR